MYALGLSAPEYAAYLATISDNHQMRRRIEILDLDHNLVLDVTPQFNDGQVNIDAAGQVTRSMTASFFDPTHSIGIDSDNPGAGVVSPRYMLRAWREVYVRSIGAWIGPPVFTGPINQPSRVGDVLTLEAQGKEYLSQPLTWKTRVLKKGLNKVDAIRQVMGEVAGEKFFRMPSTDAKLTADIPLTREVSPWSVAQSIATGMGRTFYYDGAGYLVVVPSSDSPVFTFTTGYGGVMGGPASIGYGSGEIYNLWTVTGQTPKGKKTPVTGTWIAPANHPLSPTNLARGGVERYLPAPAISDDSIKSSSAAAALAKKSGESDLLQSVSLDFPSMVVAHLEEPDSYVVTDNVAGYTIQAKVTKVSIPLTCSGTQSNGVLRRVSTPIRILRRAPR